MFYHLCGINGFHHQCALTVAISGLMPWMRVWLFSRSSHLSRHIHTKCASSSRHFLNVKSMFLYSTISSPLARSKRFTLFLPWQTCSFRHQLGFSGKYSSHAAITQRLFTHISTTVYIARYSYLYRWVDWGIVKRTKMPKLWNGSKGDSNLGSLDSSPAFYHRATALHKECNQILKFNSSTTFQMKYTITLNR